MYQLIVGNNINGFLDMFFVKFIHKTIPKFTQISTQKLFYTHPHPFSVPQSLTTIFSLFPLLHISVTHVPMFPSLYHTNNTVLFPPAANSILLKFAYIDPRL